MKKSFIGIIILSMSLIAFSACEKTKDQATDSKQYLELASAVTKGLTDIGNNLLVEKKTFNSKEDVIKSAKLFFGDNSQSYNAFLSEYNNAQLKTTLVSSSFTDPEINNEINKISQALQNSEDPSSFIKFLKNEFDNVKANNNLQPENKDFLLKFIVTYQVSIEYLSNNLELVASTNGIVGEKSSLQIESWWTSWGKCAAGILGGAGLGALTGLAAGSVVPALGTTAGAIIGGVAGGLLGAATAC